MTKDKIKISRREKDILHNLATMSGRIVAIVEENFNSGSGELEGFLFDELENLSNRTTNEIICLGEARRTK